MCLTLKGLVGGRGRCAGGAGSGSEGGPWLCVAGQPWCVSPRRLWARRECSNRGLEVVQWWCMWWTAHRGVQQMADLRYPHECAEGVGSGSGLEGVGK